MSRPRISVQPYLFQLRQSIVDLLPSRSLPLIDGRRWSDRILVICAVLLSWSAGSTLIERFSAARDAVIKMYPSRKRPGRTYGGFMKMLMRRTQQLVGALTEALRKRMEQVADSCWTMEGWLVFTADSSKLDCPMTPANEKEIGCASKAKSWPQMILATFVHLGCGLPWSWRLGKACSSERDLVTQMLDDLPPRSLVVADAGFIGCEFFKTLLACGHHLLIRVGANVHLIEKLGYAVKEHDGIVYLWPKDMQKLGRTPLVLRRITLVDGRNRRMVLLTSVLETERLSDELAKEIYGRRWGIELFYRTLKQTMGRGKLLSDCPQNAEIEGQWAMLGVLMLGLIMLQAKAPAAAVADQSIAQALRAVRDAMGGRIRPGRRKLQVVLRKAMRDRYVRLHSKRARHWPHRKNPRPPGEPQARMAEPEEVQLAQRLSRRRAAA
jgi:hypothetical protein